MRAIAAAAVAVGMAMTTGALATLALVSSALAAPGSQVSGTPTVGTLIGMAPNVAASALIDKNSTANLKQLLLETKTGPGAKMGPQLYILQKANGTTQSIWHDGGLRA